MIGQRPSGIKTEGIPLYESTIPRRTRVLKGTLNAVIDSGKHSNISVADVRAQIESGQIFRYLKLRLGDDIDISILNEIRTAELIGEWQSRANQIDAARKFGVECNGLCLLVAYCLEGIQHRQDNNPEML